MIVGQTEKLTNAQSMYHNYPGDLWSLLVLSVTVTSALKQRFIPLLRIHGKLLPCIVHVFIACVFLATDALQGVQNYPKRVQELMKLFVISLHNWLEKN